MKKTLFAIAALMSACGSKPLPPAPGTELKSSVTRSTATPAQSDVSAIVGANTAFGLDLFTRLAPQGNALIAPHSIELAFGMLYAGAAGDTKAAFEQTFHLPSGTTAFHPVMNYLDQQFETDASKGKARDGSAMKLNISDQLFTQKGMHVEQPYLDTLAANYGAGVNQLDFVSAAEPARVSINQWVSDRTEAKIPELFAKGAIDSDTRLVLVSTIYMDAAWAQTFDASQTKSAPFHLATGTDATVQMMNAQKISLSVGGDAKTTVVDLPYSGGALALTIVMPQALSDLEPLDATKFASLLATEQAGEFTLSMPRFTIKESYGLDDALKAMGLSVAYTTDADFSPITGDKSLFIQSSIHQTFGDVSEKGTEAAAATGISVGTSAIEVPRVVTIDRPFLFFIRDTASGQLLFVGRFTGP